MNVDTPEVITKPPVVILTPDLAVTIPIESILVTSSYVRVPPIVTLPEKSASTAVIVPANVETPDTLTLSNSVWPLTSKSPLASIAPVNVETPEILNWLK